ncbi:glycosyltransferase family 2 protein [Candidatus Saccharibacteria bacterium]|nr:glycosyltransferase family 2 protein [Candidatus Saccharibacteria bacterium]
MIKVMQKAYVVVPNWNGADRLSACLDSLRVQSQKHQVIVVDNGSIDDSVNILERDYPEVVLIRHSENKGFAGGVNAGIKYAMEQSGQYVALLNNDAIADKNWLKNLVDFLDDHPEAGIATSKICDAKKTHLDSTGDLYTLWGLPYPRGRGEKYSDKYDVDTWVFGASGGASLYRIKLFEQIGLFDEDFFAYYEDIDISFRAQLAGWKVAYVASAEVYHEISATSSQIKGFATYHTLKNLPLLLWKNVPWRLMPKIWPRLVLAYAMIAGRALSRGQFGPFFKGIFMGTILWPKKLVERYKIQRSRKVSANYINSIITHDLPPNAHKLRNLRARWWKLAGRN